MQLIENIHANSLFDRLVAYIKQRNAIFIVAEKHCINRAYKDFCPDDFALMMQHLCACDLFLVNLSNQRLSAPFLAANTITDGRTAELAFFMDLVPQAENGTASPFYSKVMGAVATRFFAGTPRATRLWVPFKLEDTVGRGVVVKPADQGCFICRVQSD